MDVSCWESPVYVRRKAETFERDAEENSAQGNYDVARKLYKCAASLRALAFELEQLNDTDKNADEDDNQDDDNQVHSSTIKVLDHICGNVHCREYVFLRGFGDESWKVPDWIVEFQPRLPGFSRHYAPGFGWVLRLDGGH